MFRMNCCMSYKIDSIPLYLRRKKRCLIKNDKPTVRVRVYVCAKKLTENIINIKSRNYLIMKILLSPI